MGYRENVANAIRGNRSHPFHNGVKMQAHHLVSKKSAQLSGMKADLEHLGYDINLKENVALIPSTLPGACHLNCQVHRGNHTAISDGGLYDDQDDDDGIHGMAYHTAVATILQAKVTLRRRRGRLCRDPADKIQDRVNAISAQVAVMLNAYQMKLSHVADSFQVHKQSGCCNETSVPRAKERIDAEASGGPAVRCDDDRDHQGQGGITLSTRTLPYLLGAGR